MQSTDTILRQYINLLEQLQEELEPLQQLADHGTTDPDRVTWGNVADLNRIVSLLRQANGKEE